MDNHPTQSFASCSKIAPGQIRDIKNSNLWMSDGNIIIAVETTYTKERHLFRVHATVLSRQSVVFSDLFSLPTPDDEETIDGCPVILLVDDLEDVKDLLEVLYDPHILPFERYHPETVRIVSGALRLAIKYQMDNLSSRIQRHLSLDWPSTLTEFDTRDAFLDSILIPPSHPSAEYYPDPADVVRLARELNLPDLLPTALYDLSRIQWRNNNDAESIARGERTSNVHILTAEDVRGCMLARERTKARMRAFALYTFTPSNDEKAVCGNDQSEKSNVSVLGGAGMPMRGRRLQHASPQAWGCQVAVTQYWSEVVVPSALRDGLDDPLRFLRDTFRELDLEDHGICVQCSSAIANRMKNERQQCWDRILADHHEGASPQRQPALPQE